MHHTPTSSLSPQGQEFRSLVLSILDDFKKHPASLLALHEHVEHPMRDEALALLVAAEKIERLEVLYPVGDIPAGSVFHRAVLPHLHMPSLRAQILSLFVDEANEWIDADTLIAKEIYAPSERHHALSRLNRMLRHDAADLLAYDPKTYRYYLRACVPEGVETVRISTEEEIKARRRRGRPAPAPFYVPHTQAQAEPR